MSKRALFIDYKIPSPYENTGLSITYHYMSTLVREGYGVTFMKQLNYKMDYKYIPALEGLGISVTPYTSANLKKHLRVNRNQYDLIFLFRAPYTANLLPIVRRHSPNSKVILHTVDLHYLRKERQAQLHNNISDRPSDIKLKQRELDMLQSVDAAILVSPIELEIVKPLVPEANLVIIPPACTDKVNLSTKALSQRTDIAFIGDYMHTPNTESIIYFIQQVLPLLQKRLPRFKLHVIGNNPPDKLRQLASSYVNIAGYVYNLGEYLSTCRLSVAPLLYGAGVKGKIITSLMHGLPCVATKIATEGMNLTNEENILEAETPENFADQIERLYNDEALWHKISSNGLASAQSKWSFKPIEEKLLQLIEDVLSMPK